MVEELDVRVQVLVQVAAGLQRPGNGAYGEDSQTQTEEDNCSERSRGQPLEPTDEARERVRCRCRHRRAQEASLWGRGPAS